MWADLHDALLYERRRVVDQDEKSLRLDEFVHHLLQQEVRQQEQNSSHQIVQTTADQNQTVFSTGPEWFRKHTWIITVKRRNIRSSAVTQSLLTKTLSMQNTCLFFHWTVTKITMFPWQKITHTVISVQTKGKSIFDLDKKSKVFPNKSTNDSSDTSVKPKYGLWIGARSLKSLTFNEFKWLYSRWDISLVQDRQWRRQEAITQ